METRAFPAAARRNHPAFVAGPVQKTLFDTKGFVRIDMNTPRGRAQDAVRNARDMAVIVAREQERLEASDAKHALEQFEKSKKRKGEAEANDELEAIDPAEAVRANIDNIVLEDALYAVEGRNPKNPFYNWRPEGWNHMVAYFKEFGFRDFYLSRFPTASQRRL
jgi:hypothetical protein